jgi:hypothetical protein
LRYWGWSFDQGVGLGLTERLVRQAIGHFIALGRENAEQNRTAYQRHGRCEGGGGVHDESKERVGFIAKKLY